MNRLSLAISDIIILDRQRSLNPDHVSTLAESMKTLGLIQPIVINQEKRLIAGAHRYAAAKSLGWTTIDVVYRETLSEDELAELELTEDIRRLDRTWQEKCIAISKIHWLKRRSAAKDSKEWGQKETGDLIGVSQASISQALYMTKYLLEKDQEIWKCENYDQAYNVLLRREQELAEAELASRHTVLLDEESFTDESISTPTPIPEGKRLAGYAPELPPEGNREPCSVCNGEGKRPDGGKCESCLGTGLSWIDGPGQICMRPVYVDYETVIIDLSGHYVKGDSIAFMHNHPEAFDHIVTDIPYGIDIDMLDQHVGIKDIDTIKEEHTVEGNLELFRQFFPAAFCTLKPNAFLISWCDIMNWQFMYDLAIGAGFKVQRWPITWVKTHQCLNQMAQFNFTKSTEIAMVCRKGTITLPEKQPTCVIEASRDDLCESINHPFAKPYECWRRLITAVSIENQSILDPFVGRGSSFLSGIQLGRNMYGVELNEQHYNAGLENIKQFYLKLNPKTMFK